MLSFREEHPRSAGTPCPDEERLRQAGLLARGSAPFRPPSQDRTWSQWHVADGSPLTVAGAARVLHPVPFESPFGEPVAGRADILQRSRAQEACLRNLARSHIEGVATGARKGLIGKSASSLRAAIGTAPATVSGKRPAICHWGQSPRRRQEALSQKVRKPARCRRSFARAGCTGRMRAASRNYGGDPFGGRHICVRCKGSRDDHPVLIVQL